MPVVQDTEKHKVLLVSLKNWRIFNHSWKTKDDDCIMSYANLLKKKANAKAL
jgi:hypothetical protein